MSPRRDQRAAQAAEGAGQPDTKARKRDDVAQARTAHLQQLRTDITTELDTILEQARQLRHVAGTRHHTGIGFITPATQERIDAGIRADKQALREMPDHGLGLDWLNAGRAAATGQTAAPVAPTVASIDAEILFTLQHWVRRLGRPVLATAVDQLRAVVALEHQSGRCDFPQSAAYRNPLLRDTPIWLDRDVPDLARHLKHLVTVDHELLTRARLERILRDLTWCTQQAAEVLQGPSRTQHTDPCPWCGRNSLVFHHRDEHGRELPHPIARCERLDRDHACECDDPACLCHPANGGNPYTERHEWSGAYGRRHRGSLDYLRILIDEAQENRDMERRAQDRLAQIAGIHTSQYGDLHLHGYTTWDYQYVPGDHECVLLDGLAPADAKPLLDTGAHCIPGQRHYVTGCIECSQQTPSDSLHHVEPWPCPTWRYTQLDIPDDQLTAQA
jgi:hypothetical protein